MKTIASPRKVVAVCVAAALLGSTSCTQDDNENSFTGPPAMAAAAVSAYNIVKVSSMTIDGNLSEWANIAVISLSDNSGRTGGVDNTAKVKLAWDDTYLYAAYDVTDTELLALQTTRDNANIYQDDEVELYIDPQGDGATATSMTATDYQLLANVRDAIGDKKGDGVGGKDASYNAASFLAKAATNGTLNASGTDGGYTVELRISWNDLGVTPSAGQFMRIDPAVGDRDAGTPPVQDFDWAGLSNFNNPSAWKDVQLVNPAPVSAYDIIKVPSMTIDGNLSDWAGVTAISIADNSGRTGGVDNTAKVKLAWNDTYLFAAYDVTDSELLALQTTRDHADIYKDDEVELYLDPQGDGAGASSMTPTDYQLLANVRDAVGDSKGDGAGGKDASYNAASFLAKAATNGTLNATGTDVGYTIELRISWSDLGVTPASGKFMRIDPAVGDRDAGTPPVQDFDWAGLSLFNNPSGWKDVKLVVDASAPATPTNLALSVVSSTQIDVSWTASTSSDVAKYNIYRATSGTPTLLTSVTGSPYHDTGLSQSTSYTYQVSAVDAAGNESAKTSTVSATTSGGGTGIPFGLWGIRPDSIQPSAIWTGGARSNKSLHDVLVQLRNNPAHLRMWWNLTSGDEKVFRKSPSDSSFDVQAWKDTLDNHVKPFKGNGTSVYNDSLSAYIQDGTLQGHSLLDDLASFEPDPTGAQIDSIAAYSKFRFPGLVTSVRARPTQLKTFSGGAPYTQLDVGWAQMRSDQGPDSTYRDAEINAAKTLKLGLVIGINITNDPRTSSMLPIADVLAWGTTFLKPVKSDYVCGFIMWNATYDNRDHPNMTTLANMAKNHVAAPCKRR